MYWRALFLLMLFFVMAAMGVNMLVSPVSNGGDGSLAQSPLVYLFLVLAILAIAAYFSFRSSRHPDSPPFNAGLFICVMFSAILLGGIIHELVHVALIQHPTQLRVHFGDAAAVFSTCCLAPGEYAYEEIA
ncbi:MAG: hypothetical protein AABY11_01625, partial [archaeon]